MYIFNNHIKDRYFKKRYVQLLLDNSKIIGVCDLDDILFLVINTEQYGFSLELSEYARK